MGWLLLGQISCTFPPWGPCWSCSCHLGCPTLLFPELLSHLSRTSPSSLLHSSLLSIPLVGIGFLDLCYDLTFGRSDSQTPGKAAEGSGKSTSFVSSPSFPTEPRIRRHLALSWSSGVRLGQCVSVDVLLPFSGRDNSLLSRTFYMPGCQEVLASSSLLGL